MTESPEDRRNSPRFDTGGALRAQLSMEAEVFYLSARGMMIRLAFAPDLGSRHGFTLVIGQDSLNLAGIVRNSEVHVEDKKAVHYVGIEFVDLTKDQEEILEHFVARKLKG